MKRLTERDRDKDKDEDEMNRILSGEDEILPSSGFAASVMDAVRLEAVTPPPIPFPWKRALPGVLVGGSALILVVIAVVVAAVHLGAAHLGGAVAQQQQISSSSTALLLQQNVKSASSWILLTLVLTFVSVKLSMRLASAGE